MTTYDDDYDTVPKTDIASQSYQGYASVRVLMLYWKDDGDALGNKAEFSQLERIFRKKFGFETTMFPIPEGAGINSADVTTSYVATFTDSCRDDELLIFCYSGHGGFINNPDEPKTYKPDKPTYFSLSRLVLTFIEKVSCLPSYADGKIRRF